MAFKSIINFHHNLQNIGFDSSSIDRIFNYLANMYQKAVIAIAESDWIVVNRGVLQGIFLDTVLLNCYINDMIIASD